MSSASGPSLGSELSEVDWTQAANYGAGAFCVGFVLSGVFVLANTVAATGRLGPGLDGGWRWLLLWPASAFYGSHVGAYGFGPFMDFQFGFGPGVVPGIAFLAVPVGVLVAAGYRSGRDHGGDRSTAPVQGGAVVVGYGILVVLSAVVVQVLSTGPGIFLGAGIFQVVLFAGLLYPVLFGGLGGYLAARRAETRGRTSGSSESASQWSSDDGVGQSAGGGGWSSGTEEVDVGQPDPEYAGADAACPSCGQDVDPGVNYCPNCGKTV